MKEPYLQLMIGTYYANIDDALGIAVLNLMSDYFSCYDPYGGLRLFYLHRIQHIFFHDVQSRLFGIFLASNCRGFPLF
jgi:hypothetical protein